MKVDGIKAALAAFYLARIHFEENVRKNADATILEDSTDGKNPYSPEHYGDVGDDHANEEEVEVEEEEVDDDEVAAVGEVMEDEEPEEEEDVSDNSASAQDEDEVEVEKGGEEGEVYNVKTLKRLVAQLQRKKDVSAMFITLREKLLSVMAEEKRRDEWTVHDEEYKLTLGYHTCCAKLLHDVESLKREEDARFEAFNAEMRAACDKDISRIPEKITQMPVHQVKQKALEDVLARLEARHALIDVAVESDTHDNIDTVDTIDTIDSATSRRPRSSVVDVDLEAGFTEPLGEEGHAAARAQGGRDRVRRGRNDPEDLALHRERLARLRGPLDVPEIEPPQSRPGLEII